MRKLKLALLTFMVFSIFCTQAYAASTLTNRVTWKAPSFNDILCLNDFSNNVRTCQQAFHGNEYDQCYSTMWDIYQDCKNGAGGYGGGPIQ